MKKIFLPILLFLISSSSQSFFGFGEGSVKDVNKCIEENNTGLILEKIVKQKCIDKFDKRREDFKKEEYFTNFTVRLRLDKDELILENVKLINTSDKVITGVELDIYVYEESSFDVFPSGKINTFFQPITSKRTRVIGNRVILKDESLEKSNQFCFESTDSTKNCVGYKVSSIHTLNIDL